MVFVVTKVITLITTHCLSRSADALFLGSAIVFLRIVVFDTAVIGRTKIVNETVAELASQNRIFQVATVILASTGIGMTNKRHRIAILIFHIFNVA
jgi:hypothetical protein